MKILLRGTFEVLFDKKDAHLIGGFTWYIANCCRHRTAKLYARSTFGTKKKRKYVYMHRLILNSPMGMVVDHINGNGLDNRRRNLRIVTAIENAKKQDHTTPEYFTTPEHGN